MKKNIKRFMTLILIFIGVVGLAACGNNNSKSTSNDKKTEITDSDDPLKIWTTSNAFKESAETWSSNSGKEVEVVVIPFSDFQTKLQQQVSDEKTAPDVFIVSRDVVKSWTEKDSVVVNLSDTFPDDVADYKAQTFENVYALGEKDAGNLMATTGEYPVGMMFYNRTIAKEILGTDDPEKVAEALDTTDKWLEVDKLLKEKYGNKTKLLGTVNDTINMLGQQRTKPYVENDVFTINSEIVDLFDQGKIIYDNQMYLSDDENEAVQAGYNDNSFFVNFLPSWGFSSKIEPQIKDGKNAGEWGVTTPTVGYLRGGSYFLMTKTSQNKKSAWEYIKAQTVDNKNLEADQKAKIGVPSSKTALDELVSSDIEVPLLGDEKVYDWYQKEIEETDTNKNDIVTKYDSTIVNLINNLIKDYGSGNITKEEALSQLGDQVKNAYPELTVKEDY